MHRVCDTVIAHLAADEADLRARVAALEAERATYREIASEAIHVLHHVTVERDRLSQRYHQLLEQHRQLRADLTACRRRAA